jgi:hypothetical protein
MEDPWRLFIRLLGCYAKEGTDVSFLPSTFTPLHTFGIVWKIVLPVALCAAPDSL